MDTAVIVLFGLAVAVSMFGFYMGARNEWVFHERRKLIDIFYARENCEAWVADGCPLFEDYVKSYDTMMWELFSWDMRKMLKRPLPAYVEEYLK